MTISAELNTLSILALVASDAAYKTKTQYDAERTADGSVLLRSFPDSAKAADEQNFPHALLASLSNDLGSLTAYALDTVANSRSGAFTERITFTNWELIRKFQNDGDGFGAAIFKSKELNERGEFEFIVAFQGSDGTDSKDWFANLDLAKNLWDRRGSEIIDFLVNGGQGDDEIDYSDPLKRPSAGVIHFTGQSLGGGLAQIGAYFYAKRLDESGQASNLTQRMTLVTFNSFGAVAGIDDLERAAGNTYQTNMLAGTPTIHYAIQNDIVHRLGTGNPAELAALGGSWHVNGTGNSYLFNFARINPDGMPATDRNLLNLVDAHRIEGGFYRGFANYEADFASAFNTSLLKKEAYSYIDTHLIQNVGTLLSRIFSNGETTNLSAGARTVVGVLGGVSLGPISEYENLKSALIDTLYQAGEIDDAGRAVLSIGGSAVAIKTVLIRTLSAVSKPLGALGWLFSIGLEIFSHLSAAEKPIAIQEFTNLMPADRHIQYHTISDDASSADRALRYETYSLYAAQFADSADRQELLSNELYRDVVEQFEHIDAEPDELAAEVIGGEDWVHDVLHFTQSKATQANLAAADIVDLDVTLLRFFKEGATRVEAEDPATAARIQTALTDFVRDDFARALANANFDFTAKYALTNPSAFGATQLDFVDYDRYHDALVEASRDSKYVDIKTLIEEALAITDSAGQLVDLEAERPTANPFDNAGFDPNSAPLPSEQVTEGGVKRFTLSLPYSAGEDGQRIAIALDGTAASNIRLLANGEEVVPQNGVYTVTMAKDERELELSLWGQFGVTEPGLTEAGTVSLSATLVDGTGQPTHQAHVEANADFVVSSDLIFEGPPISVFSDANDTVLFSVPGARLYVDGGGGDDVFWGDAGEDNRFLGGAGHDRLFGSFRLYEGNNDRDWLSGGSGNDQLLGGEGDDLLEGDSGSDIVLGDVGNDFLFGGSQADYDTIFTLAGLDSSGDLVQGGAGDDLVVGSAGHDRLSGGNGADLIFGGAGNDELRGDTEFIPTHSFHIVGSTFPPVQPLAGGADVLYGNAGNDTLLGEMGNDRLYGGEGSDTLVGGEGQDELHGGSGDDFLVGDADSLDPTEHADDYLHGGEGNDFLRGQGGNDTLIGDAGDDLLEGGDGADIYVFNRGDGVDTILDDGSNTVRFGPGIHANDLRLGLGSLYISVGTIGDAIRIENFNPDDVQGSYAIDNFEFFDGTRLTYADLIARGFELLGTEEDDFIAGTNVTDRITGGEGNDELDGGAGVDAMIGGPGDDTYIVDEPGDVIHEAHDEGNDAVKSSAVSYVLGPDLEILELTQQRELVGGGEGGGGQIIITGGIAGTGNELDNEIFGNALDNVLDGGGGNDRLSGDLGNDTYLFARGSGADTIIEFDDTPGNADTIQFASDVAAPDVEVLQEENDLVLAVRHTTDRIRIQDWFISDAAKIELAEFADGTTWDAATLESMAMAGGENSAPTLANAIADRTAPVDAAFSFVLPSDAFFDADAGDALAFGAALADGTPLPDWLTFDAATQTLNGTPTNEDVGAFDVTVTATDAGGLSAADTFTLTVVNVNDAPVLAQPLSDSSGNQNAALSFQISDGAFSDADAGDELNFTATREDGSPLPLWLEFDAGIRIFSGTPSEFNTGSVDVRVTATDAAGASVSDAFTLFVSDASTVNETHSGTRRRDVIATGFANDLIDAQRGDDLVHAGAGRDIVFGGKGEDSLYGEFGNDRLYGGKHDDALHGGQGEDLLYGGAGHDRLDGGEGNDLLSGGPGHDHIVTGGGDNVVIGGAGHDKITGGVGREVFLFNPGDGTDRLHLSGAGLAGNEDTLSLGGGITAGDIYLKRDDDDLIVLARDRDGRDERARVTLTGWYRDSGDHQSVTTLQLFEGEASSTYDFQTLVARFDAETQGRRHGGAWSAAEALSEARLTSGSESIGGAIAREYAMSGKVLWDVPLISESDEERAALPGENWMDPPALPERDQHETRRGQSGGTGSNDEDSGKPGRGDDRLGDLLQAYLMRAPQYDFDALARAYERSDRAHDSLNPDEIARQWQRVSRYVSGLAMEYDEDARWGAASWRLFGDGILGTRAGGGGFGYAASTGAARVTGNFETLKGLEEGFHRLQV